MRASSGLTGAMTLAVCVLALGCGKTPTNDPPDSGWYYYTPTGGGNGNNNNSGADGGEDGGDGGHLPDAGHEPLIRVDLRADVNRDGLVNLEDPADDTDEEFWTATQGAVFLANIDDDTDRCAYSNSATAAALAACHDAQDEVVNGDDDLLDLAIVRIAPWPEAPDGTVGLLSADSNGSTPVANNIRLFRNEGTSWSVYAPGTELDVQDLRTGVTFALEAKDIVRDRSKWDGYVNLTLSVAFTDEEGPRTENDVVRFRVSPVMTFHHLEEAQTVFVTDYPNDAESDQFQAEISAATTTAGITAPVTRFTVDDLWTQDYFETGYMALPSTTGQHVIRVNYRSPNYWYPNNNSDPLRLAGRVVYLLKGPDTAAVQQFDPSSPEIMDSLNSFGNTETIPPYEHNGVSYPLGRGFRGSTSTFYPDRSFTTLLESQAVQPPVYVDTEWLLVGHVDETVSFLKANNARGWIMLVNDARLARQMLETEQANGNGNVSMFVGKSYPGWPNGSSAQVTINQVLSDAVVMNESAAAAAEVDAQLAKLQAETGITEAELVRVPFLHEPVDGYSLAYQPGTVNMLVLTDSTVAVPDPFGPVINGVDIFKKQLEDALAPHGYTIVWVDDWDLYHVNAGEVHCGTNTARAIPSTKWWETGR